jgi:hypothetical protein
MNTDLRQILRDHETKIEKGLEDFFATGQELKAIRDDELYRHDGFETWAEYCTRRWDFSKRQCDRLILASKYRKNLPSPDVGPNGSCQWLERAVRGSTRAEYPGRGRTGGHGAAPWWLPYRDTSGGGRRSNMLKSILSALASSRRRVWRLRDKEIEKTLVTQCGATERL